MYVIIVGAGAIGTPLIEMATHNQHDVVVIEKDATVADRAAEQYDCLVLNDDATTADALEDAGIEKADAIISTTDVDATNIMVMLLADERDVPSRVSVVQNAEHMDLFRRVGANVIENPQHLIAEHLYRAVQRPSIKDVLHLAGDAEVFEITVTGDAAVAGLTLQEAAAAGYFDDGLLVVAIERDGDVLMPDGDTRVQPGDLATVFSKRGFAEEVVSRFAPQSAIP